mmetsp:Transcript_69885/g.123664  ORF Transcript_69885/g.123664 Transcript_69885/m.123664 type:complete len:454 (-) Transcript_69885:72-1433(-)
MFTNSSAVEAEEKRTCEVYVKQHKIDDLLQDLVEGLLRDRPQNKAKEYLVSVLRLQILQEHKESEELEDAVRAADVAEVPGYLLKNLFAATKKITAEIVPKYTINIIIQETMQLLNCEKVSLFVFDPRINMLVLNANGLDHPIRVKPGQGIVGHVFHTRATVNIPDCYKDDRFDRSFDLKTGFCTNNLLTMPILDFENQCMGVLQAVNKLGEGHFTTVDEVLMDNLAEHAGNALRNSEVYSAALVTNDRAQALLKMLQYLGEDLGAQSLVLGVATHARKLVNADRCTVFLVDEQRSQLWCIASDSGKEIRIPKSAGIAGECACENQLILIDDAYQDERFNQQVDLQTGYKTQSMICVPVKRQPDRYAACAVIQMINKTEFDGQIGKFDEEDIQVLETFASFVASKLANSALLTGPADNRTEASMALEPSLQRRASQETTIREENVEEGETGGS